MIFNEKEIWERLIYPNFIGWVFLTLRHTESTPLPVYAIFLSILPLFIKLLKFQSLDA